MARFFWIALACLTAFAVPHVAFADVVGRIAVIDGDTFDVSGTRVRLYGIDAPEQDQTCETEQGVDWACGAWVSAKVRERYQNRRTRCVPVDRDRYGRVVARCYVNNKDVAQDLVRAGFAFAYRQYAMDYDLDEKAAAVRDAGLHGSRVQTPARYRQNRSVDQRPPNGACVIKGNISSKGARIYHSPGQHDYNRTRIRMEKGERWFCTAAEAEAAGWRAARR